MIRRLFTISIIAVGLALGSCENQMTHPFTPLQTFTDDVTPKIDADFLNQLQLGGVNAIARPFYLHPLDVIATSAASASTIPYACSALMIKDAATSKYTYLDSFAGSVVVSGLSSNTFYYGYAVSTNGTPTVEYSTTAPTTNSVNPLWKTGDETRRYLFTFYATGAAAVRPFYAIRGKYLWLDDPVYIVASAAGSTSFSSSVSIATAAPDHSKRLLLQVALRDNNGSGANLVKVRPGNTTIPGIPVCDIAAGGVDIKATEPVVLPRIGDGGVEWKTAAADGVVDIAIQGWEE